MPLLVRYVIELAPLWFEGHALSFCAQVTIPRLSATVMRTFPHTEKKEQQYLPAAEQILRQT